MTKADLSLSLKIPSGRSFLAAAVQNENLYVFGGNGDQNTRSNELYRFKVQIKQVEDLYYFQIGRVCQLAYFAASQPAKVDFERRFLQIAQKRTVL